MKRQYKLRTLANLWLYICSYFLLLSNQYRLTNVHWKACGHLIKSAKRSVITWYVFSLGSFMNQFRTGFCNNSELSSFLVWRDNSGFVIPLEKTVLHTLHLTSNHGCMSIPTDLLPEPALSIYFYLQFSRYWCTIKFNCETLQNQALSVLTFSFAVLGWRVVLVCIDWMHFQNSSILKSWPLSNVIRYRFSGCWTVVCMRMCWQASMALTVLSNVFIIVHQRQALW